MIFTADNKPWIYLGQRSEAVTMMVLLWATGKV